VSVSFALSQELQTRILNALAKLDQAGDTILGLSILDTKLPVIDKSINELFHHTTGASTSSPNVGDFLKLKDAVAAYFAGGYPTVAGLIQTLETKALDLVGASAHGSLSEGPFSISGGLDPATKQLVFDVRLNPHFNKDLALNLGDKATALGLSLTGTTNLSVDVGLDLDAEFGIDLNHFLSDPTSITASDVFLQVNTLTASGAIHAADVNFGATFGGAGIQVADGSVDFTPSATLTVQKPDGTKKLTLQDLQSISLGDLVSLSTSGALSATLPISGTLPGNLGNLGTATVVVQD